MSVPPQTLTPAPPLSSSVVITDWQRSNDAFQRQVREYQLSSLTSVVIAMINYPTRFARVVAFPVLLKELFSSFGIHLSATAVLGLTLFSAGEVAHSELHFYEQLITNAIKVYAAKWKIAGAIVKSENQHDPMMLSWLNPA